MRSWKYALIAALLPASLWAATVTGTVHLATTTGVGVAGVKVVITIGNSAGVRLDSVLTDSTGHFSIADTGIKNGAHTYLLSESGYNPGAVLFTVTTDTSHVTVVPVITINNKTSVIVGFVKRAKDSAVVANATVTLTGGPNDPASDQTTHTDSTGRYEFDSIPTGTGYTVTVTAANYLTASTTNIAESWNATTNVATFYLTQNLGALAGVVASSAAGNPVIAGAKVVISSGGVAVDSTVTNAVGQFTFTDNAASYTVVVSAAGFRDSLGNKTKTVTSSITFGTTTNIIVHLVTATSTVSGTVHINTATGATLAGAQIILQYRATSTSAWVSIDTTITDANGIYVFTGEIAAAGAGATASDYRIMAVKTGSPAYGTSLTNPNPVTTAVFQVALGATVTENITLFGPVPIMSVIGNHTQAIRFSTEGDRLALDLGMSNVARSVSIFSLNGMLQYRTSVAAGESRTTVPASFSKGFLFQVR